MFSGLRLRTNNINLCALVKLFLLSTLIIYCPFAQGSASEKIRVALFLDKGAHARPQVFTLLRRDQSILAEIVTGEDIRQGCLKNFDVLFMPGGSGKREALSLEGNGQDKVRQFVKNGGIYLGVCAGCYLASCARTPYLGIIPATTVDKEHWRRGVATLPIEFTPLGMKVFGVDRSTADVIYHNGPVLQIYKDHEKDVIPLSYFRNEVVAKNGTPGLMTNAPAMVLCGFGNGLVLGISPHPEATPGLTNIEVNAIHWLYKRRNQSSSAKEKQALPIKRSIENTAEKLSYQAPVNTLSSKIYSKAEDIFEHTISSHYEHLHEGADEQVENLNGRYKITADCSGFVSYIINSIAPKHYAVLYEMTGHTYPRAKTYAAFFRQLDAKNPEDGWLQITDYRNLRQGDLIAWERKADPAEPKKSHTGSGHVMIVADPPKDPISENYRGQTLRYVEICVIDSSSVEHFAPQSLPPLIHQSSRDGVGKGIIRLMLNDKDDVIGFWEGSFSHERNKAINGPSYTNKIAFARLVSLENSFYEKLLD